MSRAEEFLNQYEVDGEDIIESLVRTLTDFEKWLEEKKPQIKGNIVLTDDDDPKLHTLVDWVVELRKRVGELESAVSAGEMQLSERIVAEKKRIDKLEVDLLRHWHSTSSTHIPGS